MKSQTSHVTDRSELAELSINTIRTLAIDAVEKAKSGHPGAPMGMAPMAYVLWNDFLKHDPNDPDWMDRDRFILSAGHASMLIYSLLHLTGYDLSLEELKAFRQFGSKTPGHPEYKHTKAIETTTGPLGQGFATGVGMAMAERHLAERFNREGFEVVDHYTYAIVSDGDLMEGVASEAASLAGHLQLGKMIYLYDSNRISIDGSTDLSFTEDVGGRFEAYGWQVLKVADGNDIDAIAKAITEAQLDPRPSLISVSTTIGYGAPNKQNTSKAHGEPLGEDEARAAKESFGWPEDSSFFIPEDALNHMREACTRGAEHKQRWGDLFEKYRAQFPNEAEEFERLVSRQLPVDWDQDLPKFTPQDGKIATRKASGQAINAIAPRVPELAGGSADLAGSNNTDIEDEDFFAPGRGGRNIHFGVREHAMGAALNGMTLHGGMRPFGATFLIFSDYVRPAVRLAALMQVPSIFIFTHDSIGLGEDGPTHQPVEHLAALRAIPHLLTFRPCDANETAEAWRFIIGYLDGPVALCLTRQGLPVLEATAATPPPVERGAYVLNDSSDGTPDVILIATGSEVQLIEEARERLAERGVTARTVSMPCWELFEAQSAGYRDSVLPPSVTARVAIEAAATFGWTRWTGDKGAVIGLNRFGASAPGDVVMAELGFTTEAVLEKALEVRER